MKRFLQWMALVIGIISVEASTRLSDLNSLQDELEHLIGHQTQGIKHLNNLEQRADELDRKRLGLSQFEESLTTRTKDLERKIQLLHSKQLQLLARNLNQVIKLELLSRESEDVIPSFSANSTISTSSMENLLQGLIVIEEAKLELSQWIQTVAEAKIQKARVAKAEAQLDRLKAKKLSKIQKMAKKENLKCLTPSEGAQLVQQTLVEHRSSGPPNHLATATVIHEYTSDTYSPPPASEDLLGNVWWRKFVPEDWEKKLLPEGWEKWNVALPSAFSRFVGIDGAATLPPEAIMDPNVHPGACWPLNGDKGHVTLRLAQPIRFESITIDHSLLSTTKFTNSAPRYFEIVGYPPSSTDSWGLDMTKGKVLSSFEFDPSQKSSSTFFKTPELPKEGSCTEVKPSCDAPMIFSSGSNSSDDDFFLAGIMIRITGNWGNPDYTCLYHVRLHGSLV